MEWELGDQSPGDWFLMVAVNEALTRLRGTQLVRQPLDPLAYGFAPARSDTRGCIPGI